MRKVMGIAAAVVLMMLWSAATYAQYGYDYPSSPGSGLAEQLRTARTHATYAAQSEILRGVREHLGHVVNCLEGPRGKNFDAKNDNPCQGQGSGVIPDLESAVRSGQTGASRALEAAREADKLAVETLAVSDLARAKTAASRVANVLGEALRAVGQ